MFELYEIRRDNPAFLLTVRAVDGISVYCGNERIVDFQIAQRHLLVNAPRASGLYGKGDKLFGKTSRHPGSGTRMWKIDEEGQVMRIVSFLRKLPKLPQQRFQESRSIPQAVRELVLDRDGGKCVVPGCNSLFDLHFDHMIPFSKGGSSNDPKNIRLMCGKHNLEQGATMKY